MLEVPTIEKNTCCRHWKSNVTPPLSIYCTFSALLRTCSSLPEIEGALYSCVISICCFYSIQNTLQALLPASKEKHSSYLQFRFGSNDDTLAAGGLNLTQNDNATTSLTSRSRQGGKTWGQSIRHQEVGTQCKKGNTYCMWKTMYCITNKTSV